MTLWTTGQISRKLGIPMSTLDYTIRSNRIDETCRVGILRAFDSDRVEQIISALRRMNPGVNIDDKKLFGEKQTA